LITTFRKILAPPPPLVLKQYGPYTNLALLFIQGTYIPSFINISFSVLELLSPPTDRRTNGYYDLIGIHKFSYRIPKIVDSKKKRRLKTNPFLLSENCAKCCIFVTCLLRFLVVLDIKCRENTGPKSESRENCRANSPVSEELLN